MSVPTINWSDPMAQGLLSAWPCFLGPGYPQDACQTNEYVRSGNGGRYVLTNYKDTWLYAPQSDGSATTFQYGIWPNALNGTTRCTIMCRLYRSASGVWVNPMFATDANNGFSIQWYSDNNMYAYLVTAGAGGYPYLALNFSGWHDFIFDYDGGAATNALKLRFWFDGTEQTYTGASGSAVPTTWPNVANLPNINGDYGGTKLTGAMFDVRILRRSRPFTDAEAKAYTDPATRFSIYEIPKRRSMIGFTAAVGTAAPSLPMLGVGI